MSLLQLHLGKPAAWIEAVGDDTFAFLQGQASNDLRSTSPNPVTYTLWLDRKGKVLADAFVMQQGPGHFFLYSYHSPARTLIERLEPYIIADDVTLRDLTPQANCASLWGEGVEAALRSINLPFPTERCLVSRDHRFLIHGRRSSGPNADLIVMGEDNEETIAALSAAVMDQGGELVDETRLERLRLEAGIPAIPTDIGPGELPQEGGLDKDALSYDKGCYLGQEVMARIRSMGQVRRSLTLVSIRHMHTHPGAKLFANEREVGEIRSVAPGDPALGLALIRIDSLRQVEGFSLEPNANANVIPVRENES
jgi:tRNA-modifying protein YgfZ